MLEGMFKKVIHAFRQCYYKFRKHLTNYHKMENREVAAVLCPTGPESVVDSMFR